METLPKRHAGQAWEYCPGEDSNADKRSYLIGGVKYLVRACFREDAKSTAIDKVAG